MKRFVFRLATLQRVRKLRLREARVELARAVAEAAASSRRRESLDSSIRTCAPDPGSHIDSSILKHWSDWHSAATLRLAELVDKERDARNRVIDCGATYERKQRDLRLIERLRSRRFRKWQREAERDETLNLDETFLLGRTARRAGGGR